MAYDIYSNNSGRELTGGSGNSNVNYNEYRGSDQDDSGHSRRVRDNNFVTWDRLITSNNHGDKNFVDVYQSNYFRSLFGSYDIRSRQEIRNNLFTKTYRFGLMNPYGAISTGREFLFFTKPDLNIYAYNSQNGSVNPNALNENLRNIPFWQDLFTYKRRIIDQLEDSAVSSGDRFNHLLQNQCSSNLEISALEATMVDTPQNMFGVGFSYRGSSESSDDNPSFSLEFKDNRWLDTYTFFKAYEEYEKLKAHGLIRPKAEYAINKIVHDQFSIYKFIVDEDMETIIYYGKMYGVVPTSLPRDTFGSPTFDGGLSYNVSFKAAFYEDMIPDVLADFNALSRQYFSAQPYSIPIYNKVLDNIDSRPASAAYVLVDKESPRAKNSPNGYIYKLCWKGSDT
jgi:hypothetical protein